MRKAQKNQAEEIMRLLAHVHEGIKKAIETGRREEAMGLLAQCQESAINLGEMIEETEGEGTEAVSSLEEYCENVYQIYSMLEQKQSISGQKAWKSLRRALIQAENHIKNDIKVRVEAVFLPYKASMWDSLESVWRAADEDPDCDAYVIPIPYYDKNPDGSFREEHYEGELYPEDVSVIWYEDYDFASRKPDMIFIHNPYDNCNYVTSVHPFFYSQNLKQYTDELVYIPYFVLGEIEPNDKAATKGMVNFCNVPAVYYADKVIVQSEKMRQVYINVLSDITKNTLADEKYWGEKILGLGSPKVDKVLSTRKENVEVPGEWLRIIEKPDGSWKKIIFYNTGLTGLLQHDEKMLVKMRDVFRVFRENRDEVALLWRPHPLIKATIKSMRPHLWEEYEKIVEEYKEAGWGIYDDRAEMDRAIALCDAYYGDHSSLVRLCQEAGKLVMIQNPCSLPENNYSLAMDNIVEYQDKWWFLALKDNGIYRMNKETFKASLVARIPWDKHISNTRPHYGKVYFYQDKLFVIPWAPVPIVVYDMKIQHIHYIDYEKEDVYRGMVFCEGIMSENRLYLIPSSYENILCINMETESVEYIRLNEALDEPEIKHNYAWGSVFFDGEIVYMTMIDSGRILSCNLKLMQVNVYQSEWLTGGAAGICGDEADIWILPLVTDKIIHWDRKQKKVDVLDCFPQGYSPGNWSFHKMILDKEILYLLPRTANMCIAIDRKNMQFHVLDRKNDQFDANNFYDKYMRYSNLWASLGKLYVMNSRQGIIYCVDSLRKTEPQKRVQEVTILIENDKMEKGGEYWEGENRFDNITTFIDTITQRVLLESSYSEQMLGKDIWRYMYE